MLSNKSLSSILSTLIIVVLLTTFYLIDIVSHYSPQIWDNLYL